MIVYVLASFLEYFIHKYPTHCNTEGKFNKIMKKRNLTSKLFSEICENHIDHHKEVKPDMKLTR